MEKVANDFSVSEVQDRLARVQTAIKERGLDGLIIFDNGAIIGSGSVRYLSGYSQVSPPLPAFAFVAPAGSPTLCFSDFVASSELNYHDIFGPDQNVVVVGAGQGLAKDMGGALGEIVTKEGISKGTIGVDGLGSMANSLVQRLRAVLPDVELVDATRIVEWVRREKSDAEIANFVRAAELSKRFMDRFIEAVQPGVRQDAAVSDTMHATEQAGADELGLIHGCGTPWYWGLSGRGPLTFQDGDLVACELNARYHGYYGQVCRTWALGKVSAEKDKLLSAVRSASDKMINAMKPGMTGKEIYQVGLKEVQSRGYDWCGVRFGHGLGLTIGEGFDAADWDDSPGGTCLTPISEGAVGVFHPFLIERDGSGRGVFNAIWGDPWVLREHGPELV